MEALFIGLLGFVVLGSLVALEVRSLLSAVIALGVAGLGLSTLFLLLGAPDIAITQVVVEVIVVTVLIRTASRVETESEGRRRDRIAVVAGLALVVVLLGFLVHVFAALPPFGAGGGPLAEWYLTHGTEGTGASNIVTAILLDYRGYDTLGEATVILAAVLGTLVVLRARAKAKKPDSPPEAPGAETRPEPVEAGHA